MKNLTKSYLIKAPIEKVWKALTDSKTIDDWGGGPAKMNSKEGASFSLWGGDIWGKNIKSITGKTLEQEWYAGHWQKPSIVSFKLKKVGQKTEVKLNHTDIPDNEFDGIKSGWDEYYMGPLSELIEK